MEKKHELRLSEDLVQSLKGIMIDMTKIDYVRKTHRNIKNENLPQWVTAAMRSCVHVILDGDGKPQYAADRRADGKLYCTACGRVINDTFDKAAVEAIYNALPSINQALMFGMSMGLDKQVVNSIVAVKVVLPDIAQVLEEECNAVNNSNKNDAALDAIGNEYNIDDRTTFTSFH